MRPFKNKILIIQTEDLPLLAANLSQLIEKNKGSRYLNAAQLATELGIEEDRIKAAIKEGHYGYIHPGLDKGEHYYATLSEATAYHVNGISKKGGLF